MFRLDQPNSQPLLYHTLHLLDYLGMVGWAPECLSLVCGSPVHRYCTFAIPEYSNYYPGSASPAHRRVALLFCKDILLSVFQCVVNFSICPLRTFFFFFSLKFVSSWLGHSKVIPSPGQEFAYLISRPVVLTSFLV